MRINEIWMAVAISVTVFGSEPLRAQGNVPVINSLNPASRAAGSGDFDLIVTGENFREGATVHWRGTARTTQPVSATQLRARIRAADIAQAGTAPVTVRQRVGQQNRESNSVAFTITATSAPQPPAAGNPVPAIASLSPAPMTVGAINQDLYVDGSGFVAGTRVRWNGSDRATDFVSPTRVIAVITGDDLAAPRTVQITTFNPEPGGGASQVRSLEVVHPRPTITSLNPATRSLNGAQFTLTVNGTGFLRTGTNIVRWRGQPRETQFVSAIRLTATIPASDLTTIGDAAVTVETRAGTSTQTSAPATVTVLAAATVVTIASTPLSITRFHIGGASNPERILMNEAVDLFAEHSGTPAPTHWKYSIDDGRVFRTATWRAMSTPPRHTFTTAGEHVLLFQYRRIVGSDTTVSNVARDTVLVRRPWATPAPVVFGDMTGELRRLHCPLGEAAIMVRVYRNNTNRNVVDAIGVTCGRGGNTPVAGSTANSSLDTYSPCTSTNRLSRLTISYDAELGGPGASQLVLAPLRGRLHGAEWVCGSSGPARFNSLYARPEGNSIARGISEYQAHVGCPSGAFPIGLDVYLKRISPLGAPAYDAPSAVGFVCAKPD